MRRDASASVLQLVDGVNDALELGVDSLFLRLHAACRVGVWEQNFQTRRKIMDLNFRQVLRVSLTGATLAFVAGYVNAVSLSSVYRLTVTHMTGVVARLGLDISQLANPSVSERSLGDDIAADLCVLFGFLIGSVCTGIVVGPSLYYRMRVSWRYGVGLILEALCLSMMLIFHSTDSPKAALFFAGTGMGLQNSLTSVYSGSLLRTTHLTGVWTDIGVILGQGTQQLVYWIFRKNDELQHSKTDLWRLKFNVPIMTSYFVGAWAGFLGFYQFGINVLVAPVLFTGMAGCVAIYLDRQKNKKRKREGRQRIYEVMDPVGISNSQIKLGENGDDTSPDDMGDVDTTNLLPSNATRGRAMTNAGNGDTTLPYHVYMRNQTRQLVSVTSPPANPLHSHEGGAAGIVPDDQILEQSSTPYLSSTPL